MLVDRLSNTNSKWRIFNELRVQSPMRRLSIADAIISRVWGVRKIDILCWFFFVLCTLCCQFLWIVLLLFTLWYSLSFINESICIYINSSNLSMKGSGSFYAINNKKMFDQCSIFFYLRNHYLNAINNLHTKLRKV